MGQVIILQGISGAGKSTYAAKLGGRIVSANDYFQARDGYRFAPAKLGEAHAQCMRRFIEMVQGSEPLVIVDNTNTTVAEIAPYYSVGQAYGYAVRIVRVVAGVQAATARGRHGQVRGVRERHPAQQ